MKEKKIFYGWFIVFGSVLITATMVPLIMSLSNKFLIPVTQEMNISRSSFTLANTILQALGIFLSPIVAKFLVKGNFKRIHSISVLGFALAYASYSLAQNVYHFYISAVFVGIFYLNATMIPVSMMITNWFEKKRGLAMSIAMAGIGVGGFIFSPIVTHFLGAYGWRTTYLIMAAVVAIIGLPTSLLILKQKPEDMGLKPYGADEVVDANSKTKPESAGVSLSVGDSKGKIFFILLMVAMFTNGLINSGSLGQFPPAMEEMHGPALQATIISIYSLVGIFGKIIVGWVNDKFGVIVSSIYGCAAFALAFAFMLLGHNPMMLYPMAFFFGLGNAIGTVSPTLVVADVFGSKKYGEAYGIANSATQIGLSVGSLLVASIYDLSGAYTMAWVLLLVLTVVTMFGWIGSIVTSKKYRPEAK